MIQQLFLRYPWEPLPLIMQPASLVPDHYKTPYIVRWQNSDKIGGQFSTRIRAINYGRTRVRIWKNRAGA